MCTSDLFDMARHLCSCDEKLSADTARPDVIGIVVRQAIAHSLRAETTSLSKEIDHMLVVQAAQASELQCYHTTVMPAFDDAVAKVECLRLGDIVEVRCLAHPPLAVKLVIEALCIMFDIQPALRADPMNPQSKINDYWHPAKRLLLCDANRLIENICAYDMNHMSPEVLERLACFTTNPDFLPERARLASLFAEAVCRWAHAIHKCQLIYRPLNETMKQIDMTLERLTLCRDAFLARAEEEEADL